MVVEIFPKDSFQMAFIPDDDMISAFSSNTAVESFDMSVLPRTVVVVLDEKQHHQTLIWKRLKRNGINVYEYLRETTVGQIQITSGRTILRNVTP